MTQPSCGEPPVADRLAELGSRVSEAALVVADVLLPAADQKVREDLHLLRGARLNVPRPRSMRHRRFALALYWLEAQGVLPTAQEYADESVAWASRGEDVPLLGEVVRSWGTYAAYLEAAARLFHMGTAAHQDASPWRPPRYPKVTYSLVLDQIEAVKHKLSLREAPESWPTKAEYMAVAMAGAYTYAAHGLHGVGYLHIKQIEALFDNYGNAVRAARRRATDREVRSGGNLRDHRDAPTASASRSRPRRPRSPRALRAP